MNGTKLSPSVPHVLQEHDEIQIGVPEAPGRAPSYVWTFHKQYKVKVITTAAVTSDNNNMNSKSDVERRTAKQKIKQPPGTMPFLCSNNLSDSQRNTIVIMTF